MIVLWVASTWIWPAVARCGGSFFFFLPDGRSRRAVFGCCSCICSGGRVRQWWAGVSASVVTGATAGSQLLQLQSFVVFSLRLFYQGVFLPLNFLSLTRGLLSGTPPTVTFFTATGTGVNLRGCAEAAAGWSCSCGAGPVSTNIARSLNIAVTTAVARLQCASLEIFLDSRDNSGVVGF